jgi:hypothetical protein
VLQRWACASTPASLFTARPFIFLVASVYIASRCASSSFAQHASCLPRLPPFPQRAWQQTFL